MKELSIEEKARRYDEAIKVINKCETDKYGCIVGIKPSDLFPELVENEDEKIRKEIIDFLANTNRYGTNPKFESWLVWLEKQKPVEWSEKDAIMQNDCICAIYAANEYDYTSDQKEELANWLKSICPQQKREWSEEDENTLDKAIYMMEQLDMTESWDDVYNWLKSIKGRVGYEADCTTKQEWKQENTYDLTDFENAMMHIGGSFFGKNAGLDPNDTNLIKEQANILLGLVPNQEWSEEDELMLTSIIQTLKLTNGAAQMKIDWLKSIRPQPRWKPSEEQMEILSKYAEQNNYDGSVLTALYKELKNLKG